MIERLLALARRLDGDAELLLHPRLVDELVVVQPLRAQAEVQRRIPRLRVRPDDTLAHALPAVSGSPVIIAGQSLCGANSAKARRS